ncbi:hypothetical protein CYMTET_49546, partial [Cymbomonas tetramitiformis]
MLNKYLMSVDGFNYPIMLASLGMGFSSVGASFLIHVCKVDTTRDEVDLAFFVRKFMPIGLAAAICLSTGNMPYLYISVSYIQILKAMSPVFVLIVLSLCGLEKPTLSLVSSVLVIAIGTMIAAFGEISFSIIGTLLMIMSELMEAIKLAATQHLVGDKKLTSLQGTYYLCPATFFWLFLGSFFLEMPRFISDAQEGRGYLLMVTSVHECEIDAGGSVLG